ncbi:MAG: transglycosylase SLT domain-containing protein [Candidatus Dadabacteria bacterium]|nr:transglycosylase SLT domain-containing protein [Candidatus Dadabacteria bacterium]NIQ16960.1 transglycosylase SLT domain-containing protein [Candidatus Dadabacteria bacterium]
MNKKHSLLLVLFFLLFHISPGVSKEISCKDVLSKNSPITDDENFKKAYCHINEENFRLAKHYIDKVGTKLPTIIDHVLHYKALAEYKTNNSKSAIKILENLTSTYPSSSINKDSLSLLAEIHTDNENYSSAIKIYKKLLSKEESDWLKAKLLKAIGEIYEKQNKINRALSTFERIWIEYPNTSFSDYIYELAENNGFQFLPKKEDHLKRGMYYFEKNLWSLALPELNKSIKTNDVVKKIGICQYKLGSYNDAHENLSKVKSAESGYWLALVKKKQGYDVKAANLLSSIYKKYPESEFSPKGLLKAGEIYTRNFKISDAKNAYKKLLKMYPDSIEVASGAWNLGWIYYKENKYEKALSIFSNYNFPSDSFNTHSFKYWSAKTYEKLGKPAKANSLYKQLAESGKFTYHSFLSSLKIDYENNQSYKKNNNFINVFKNDLTRKKAEKFVRLGISELALKEIRILEGKSNSFLENYYISSLYFKLGNYYSSIKFADKQFDPNFTYLSFPMGFENTVSKLSRKYGLDEFLVYSLIREESRFNRKAVSVSNARGLMQLIPPTARETARKVGINNFSLQKLYIPEINIDLGCYYLNLVMSRFKGNIPLSLAGYNAGPNRAAQWHAEMGDLPVDEFIEEIPFNETNYYVKRILRSYGAYKALYKY